MHIHEPYRRVNIVLADFHGEKSLFPRSYGRRLLGGSAYRTSAVLDLIKSRVNSDTGRPVFHDAVVLFGGDLQDPASNDMRASKVLVQELNRYGCKYFAVGDHDIENGLEFFYGMMDDFKGKILSLTIRDKWNKSIPDILPFDIEYVRPWNIRIAHVGLTNPVRDRSKCGELTFLDPLGAYREVLTELKKFNVDLIEVQGHISAKIQRAIARETCYLRNGPATPVVYGAHSHESKAGERIGNGLRVEPGTPHGVPLIVVEQKFNLKRREVHSKSMLVTVDAGRLDPDRVMAGYLKDYLGMADNMNGVALQGLNEALE